MGKDTNFFGQPVYGQLIKLLNFDKVLKISKKQGENRGLTDVTKMKKNLN